MIETHHHRHTSVSVPWTLSHDACSECGPNTITEWLQWTQLSQHHRQTSESVPLTLSHDACSECSPNTIAEWLQWTQLSQHHRKPSVSPHLTLSQKAFRECNFDDAFTSWLYYNFSAHNFDVYTILLLTVEYCKCLSISSTETTKNKIFFFFYMAIKNSLHDGFFLMLFSAKSTSQRPYIGLVYGSIVYLMTN